MSVRAILKDLNRVAGSQSLRKHQYRAYAFDLTFNKINTEDLLIFSVKQDLEDVQGIQIQHGSREHKNLKLAASKAYKKAYNVMNVAAVHYKHSYEVFYEPKNNEKDLAEYTGYQKTGSGKKLKTFRNYKLAVLMKQQVANAGGTQVTYARSLGKKDEHTKVIKELWFDCLDACIKEFNNLSKKDVKVKPGVQGGNPTNRLGVDPTGKSKMFRLHGPISTLDMDGQPQAGAAGNDTSVPVVSIVEQLQKMKARGLPVPKEVLSGSMYTQAFKDILQELDLHFKIDGDSISSAVELFKDIRISLSTGGSDAQRFMEYADLTNVKDILKDIESKLIGGLNQNVDYIKSKKITQRTREIATGIIAAEFLTKAGNLDMRFKVNKQKALNGRKKEREKSKTNYSSKAAGSSRTTSRNQGNRIKKRGRPTKMSQAQGGNPLALKELINAVLPDVMLKNMGSPALNNRTGRFRNSAQVTNIVVGPRGGTNIEYTYMRNPYQTFEPGGAMGSTGRDPRRLIGASIREAAQKIVGTRFIKTRRV